ncbi:MAG: 30S ribosomal protein S21 [Candidatus Omnitrophota bacterium]|nr:30S ribosomal protein S21 [Candidatus Omnitrophota bacterium]
MPLKEGSYTFLYRKKALCKFIMQCKKERIVSDFRERQHYTKPSQKRREKKKKRS